ncbi:OpgC [Granulibacter bethesdensis]|nr:OpgC [Granulibacter bethesdensis]
MGQPCWQIGPCLVWPDRLIFLPSAADGRKRKGSGPVMSDPLCQGTVSGVANPAVQPVRVRKERDLRIDFFRGVSLFIILIDHIRNNSFSHLMPASFGFSDAACIFFFVSGASCAYAFGSVYRRAGWALGTARVSLRVWQIYAAQLGLVMAVAALPGLLAHVTGHRHYNFVELFELYHLYDDPVQAFRGIVMLSYVPGYLDVLPVYVVIMAMVPVAVLLAKLDRRLPVVASVLLWAGALLLGWNLPADPSTKRHWFFDPFSWQLVFFTGYALTAGWVSVPPIFRDRGMGLFRIGAVGLIVFGFVARTGLLSHAGETGEAIAEWVTANTNKTVLPPLIYLHFLAVAWLVVSIVGKRPAFLHRNWARPFITAGTYSLPVFLCTVVLAQLGTAALDGVSPWSIRQIVVNVMAMAVLALLVRIIAWYHSTPWKKPVAVPAQELVREQKMDQGLPQGSAQSVIRP